MDKVLYERNTGSYNFWMAYPACESFALSSLGYMWLYKIADMTEGINAEMICTDIYSKTRPDKVGAISFSLSFDFDFTGVFEVLKKYNIPFLSEQRDEKFPIIFAGGPVITTNPAPYAKIFDFLMIGDGEESFVKVLEILKLPLSKKDTLKELAKLEGVYVHGVSDNVSKQTVRLNEVIYTPVLSEKSYFKNTFIIELSRGCMNCCGFCTASYLNLPFRYYEYDKIFEAVELGLEHTNKIALLGAQISAHPKFMDIMRYLESKIDNGSDIEIGVSSLRTDAVTPELVQILVKGGQKTSTIAIEAASERLRKFINKNITEEQIFNAVKISRENGLKGLKIYSMIGIPNETDDDIEEFLKLAQRLKLENKGFEITFSFSSFVPKPQTPFQWSRREDTKSLEHKQRYLEKSLAKIGIGSKFSSIKWDYWQTILSRGGEELTPFMIKVYENGGKIGAYKSSLKELNIDITKLIEGYNINDKLPWDNVLNCVNKERLVSELNRLNKHIRL